MQGAVGEKMDRRGALRALGLGTAGALLAAAPARAQSGGATAQPSAAPKLPYPGHYRFAVGKFECVALNDGATQMPRQPFWAPEAGAGEAEAVLRDWYLDETTLRLAFNALVVRVGGATILLDTGNGAGARGNGLGMTALQLAAAGIAPAEVTHVFISHAHGDHINGLFDGEARAFPKAEVVFSQTEKAFWTGTAPDMAKSRLPDDPKAGMIAAAQKFFEQTAGYARGLRDGEALADGVTLLAAPGHTPGHALLRLVSDGQELVYLADSAHHPVLMFERPDWTVAFDTNPAQAAATRQALFARMAAERTLVHLFHMPFPGLGHIRAKGAGFEWVPVMWTV